MKAVLMVHGKESSTFIVLVEKDIFVHHSL